jgi:predicted nucleic acid-binding protein
MAVPAGKVRAYADTSVFGGVQDEEFREASRQFFRRVKRGDYMILLSTLTLREIAGAPSNVRRVLAELPRSQIAEIPPEAEDEAERLADAYIAAGVLEGTSRADATHVAIATVARADLILSWNFRHIVNYQRIGEFNRVNALNGYPRIEIHSPLEVAYADEDEGI